MVQTKCKWGNRWVAFSGETKVCAASPAATLVSPHSAVCSQGWDQHETNFVWMCFCRDNETEQVPAWRMSLHVRVSCIAPYPLCSKDFLQNGQGPLWCFRFCRRHHFWDPASLLPRSRGAPSLAKSTFPAGHWGTVASALARVRILHQKASYET